MPDYSDPDLAEAIFRHTDATVISDAAGLRKALAGVVYLLWRYDYDYRSVEAVCATLERAQQCFLEDRYPLTGPRGGKRPPRPVVTWTLDSGGDWTPSVGGDDYYIERLELM